MSGASGTTCGEKGGVKALPEDFEIFNGFLLLDCFKGGGVYFF